MVSKVDAHGFSGDFIVADRLKRAAIGGIDKKHNHGNADARKDKREHRAGNLIAHTAERYVKRIEILEFTQNIRAVGDRP